MKILFYKSKNFKNLKELDVVNLEVEVCQTELKEFALGAENLEELDEVNFKNLEAACGILFYK